MKLSSLTNDIATDDLQNIVPYQSLKIKIIENIQNLTIDSQIVHKN